MKISRYLAQMAEALDYNIVVCDPREEYAHTWDLPAVELNRGMPDDVVGHTAEPEAAEGTTAVGGHDDQVRARLLHVLDQGGFHVSFDELVPGRRTVRVDFRGEPGQIRELIGTLLGVLQAAPCRVPPCRSQRDDRLVHHHQPHRRVCLAGQVQRHRERRLGEA